MTEPTHAAASPRMPGMSAAFTEQVRFVGSALRREAAVGGIILLVLLSLSYCALRPDGVSPRLSREWGPMLAAIGFLAPFVLWKGRPGDAQLWILPVDHRRLALMRVAAGWLWIMAVAAALVLWVAVLILLTGGDFGHEETRLLLARQIPRSSLLTVDPADLTAVAWSTPFWLWLVPFTAGTIAYLLSSALILATDHAWRWLGGIALVLALVLFVDGSRGAGPSRFEAVSKHRYGLETVAAGGALGQGRTVQLTTTREQIKFWNALPTRGPWATTTLLGLGESLLALWLATRRHRERERSTENSAPAPRGTPRESGLPRNAERA